MTDIQANVIGAHQTELTKTLESHIDSFLTDLEIISLINSSEKQIIEHKATNKAKCLELFRIIEWKDGSLNAIINFLKDNGFKTLAVKLENYNRTLQTDQRNRNLKQLPTSPCLSAEKIQIAELNSSLCNTVPPKSQLNRRKELGRQQDDKQMEEFKIKLTEYYKSHYSRVPGIFGCHQHVNDVWVPLTMNDKTRTLKQEDKCDHIGLLEQLAKSRNAAVVKGQPGAGKTTLVKKIAYDWATNKVHQFRIVLAVLLRDVTRNMGQAEDILQLATNYYAVELNLSPKDKTNLLVEFKQLGPKLLICLDGLDEYEELARSPLAPIFVPNFKTDIPSLFQYQLLITSRPEACQKVNRKFAFHKFEIGVLDETHLNEFAQHHCETKNGYNKVHAYVDANKINERIIKVPLILTFVCYLADQPGDIPANLTLLYERILKLMLIRELDNGRVCEKVDIEDWKTSNVIKTTANLAFEGCKSRKFVFKKSILDEFRINEDSFKCGFLLQMFNFEEDRLDAEFLHRSIQESFAALHCCQLMSAAQKVDRTVVMKEIFRVDSQFGRFFFGFCAIEMEKEAICNGHIFQTMLDWLNPTFADASMVSFRFPYFLKIISDRLSDCSDDASRLFCQKFITSLEQLESVFTMGRTEKIQATCLDLSFQKASFQSCLNLNFLNESHADWAITSVGKTKWSRLTYVCSKLSMDLRAKFDGMDLRAKFDGMDCFIWRWEIKKLGDLNLLLNGLPPVSTFFILTDNVPNYEINFRIQYMKAEASASQSLRNFGFGFDERDISELKAKFTGQNEHHDIIIREVSNSKNGISWVTVTVNRGLRPHELVKMLIRWALEQLNNVDLPADKGHSTDMNEEFSVPKDPLPVTKNLPEDFLTESSNLSQTVESLKIPTANIYSQKVFVGGLPQDITEDEIYGYFFCFGELIVDWPYKGQSTFPGKGFCFLIFQQDRSVELLLDACEFKDNKFYFSLSSSTVKNKRAQVNPWRLADANYVSDGARSLDPNKKVFVEKIPRELRADQLAETMSRFGAVSYCGIDIDHLKYPKATGNVVFFHQSSYDAAIKKQLVNLIGFKDKQVRIMPFVPT